MGGTDEKQNEYKYKSLRTTRRELATAPAWVLSRGIEMAKTENRKTKRSIKQFSFLMIDELQARLT